MKEDGHDKRSIALLVQDEDAASARRIRKVVTVGCCVNALLMILKLCGGYLGHSEALVADGYHSLNDILSDIIMFVFIGLSYRHADSRFTYGYGKFGTFSSFLMSVLLIVIAGIIAFHGIESIVEFSHGRELEQPDIWTFVVILVAMCCKEGLYRYYSRTARKIDSKALLANAWHHRSDALASIATLIGVTFAHFFGPSLRVLDPIASLVIALFILIPALRLLWSSFSELMEKSLPKQDVVKAENIVNAVAGIGKLKYLRSRRIGHDLVFDLGLLTSPDITVKETRAMAVNIENEFQKEFCKHVKVSVNFYTT